MGCTLLEGMLSVFLNSAWKQGLPIQAILGELFNSSEGKGLRHCHRIREITFQDNKENWSLVFLFVGYPVAYLQFGVQKLQTVYGTQKAPGSNAVTQMSGFDKLFAVLKLNNVKHCRTTGRFEGSFTYSQSFGLQRKRERHVYIYLATVEVSDKRCAL